LVTPRVKEEGKGKRTGQITRTSILCLIFGKQTIRFSGGWEDKEEGNGGEREEGGLELPFHTPTSKRWG